MSGAEVAASGDFHNALNFAGVMRAPVVFVCRTPREAPGSIAGRAVAYGIASAQVSGRDARAVVAVVSAALARARAGQGATLIEVAVAPPPGPLEDDVLASPRVLDLGEEDPIVVLAGALAQEGNEPPAAASIFGETNRELDLAIEEAQAAGPPPPSSIFDHVYAEVPAHLAAQRRLADPEKTTKR
jgi:pyruvate dehydrogenase E1 component alpha subunit/2-oxoisovalerate dehydrogenase E1 component alpha subunit